MALLGDWGKRNSSYFSAFAMGVLLVAVILHLVPEALAGSIANWRSIGSGLVGMAAIGLILRFISTAQRDPHGLAIGYASIAALGFHSFVDGLIYEATYLNELFTGGLATAGLLLHEFPEGVIAYFLARDAGLNSAQSVVWAFIAASLTTVAGAVVASAFAGDMHHADLGPLLGLTAGTLIYIMIFHLGPHASLTPHKRGYMVASLGVVVAVFAILFRLLSGQPT
jgi:zinc transporter ZupT